MADRQFQRRRFQAQRLTTKAVKGARAELPAHLRSRVRPRASTVTDQGLRQGTEVPSALAFVSPSISTKVTFTTTQAGALVAPPRTLRGIAHHEVAHLLGAGHPAIAAAGRAGPPTRGSSLASVVQTLQAVSFERHPRERRQALLRRTPPPRMVKATPEQRLARQGFATPQLKKVAKTGTPTQQRQAREKMRRLGRRLRGRVDF